MTGCVTMTAGILAGLPQPLKAKKKKGDLNGMQNTQRQHNSTHQNAKSTLYYTCSAYLVVGMQSDKQMVNIADKYVGEFWYIDKCHVPRQGRYSMSIYIISSLFFLHENDLCGIEVWWAGGISIKLVTPERYPIHLSLAFYAESHSLVGLSRLNHCGYIGLLAGIAQDYGYLVVRLLANRLRRAPTELSLQCVGKRIRDPPCNILYIARYWGTLSIRNRFENPSPRVFHLGSCRLYAGSTHTRYHCGACSPLPGLQAVCTEYGAAIIHRYTEYQ